MRRFLAPPRPPPALSTGIGDGHRGRASEKDLEEVLKPGAGRADTKSDRPNRQ
jgi:hypothetical protein